MLVHHYTNINTLALILKNRKIRLNRLDNVDDLMEAKSMHFGQFVFISCWTYDSEESIPLWQMYTNKMSGVRITLDSEWMLFRKLKVNSKYPVRMENEILSPVDEVLTDDYFILPQIFKRENILRKVKYVDNPLNYYKNVMKYNGADLNIETSELGIYKTINWSFQKEIRYKFFITPVTPPPNHSSIDAWLSNLFVGNMRQAIEQGKGPNFDNFDVDIDPDKLNDIEITLGPACTEGDEIIVQSLLKEYTTNGKYKRSALTGNIKCK